MKNHLNTIIQRLVKGKKIFVKMLISYILLSIIPVIILGTFIYSFTSKLIINEACNNYKKSMELMVSNTDQYMINIYNLARTLSLNSEVNSYKDIDVKMSYSMAFVNFFDTLFQYKNTNQAIDSIYLYYNDRIISTENGMKWIDNFDEGPWCKKIIIKAQENYKYMIPYITEPRKRLDSSSVSRYDYYDIISVICPMGNIDYRNGMIVINLNEKTFRDNLDKIKQNNSDQIFILDRKSGVTISKSNKISSFDTLSSVQLLKYVDEAEKNKGIVYVDNKKVIMTVLHSTIPNWDYISVSDYNTITARVAFISNSIIVGALLLIILGFIISIVIVGRIYAPIQNIISNVLNLQLKPETDEVASIRNYIDQILVTSDYNKQLLNKSLPSMKENIFMNLLRGRIVDEGDLVEQLKLCDIELKDENYIVVVLAIDAYSIFVQRYSLTERLNYKYYILEVVGEKLKEISFTYGTEIDQDKICFVMNIKQSVEIQTIKNIFADIKESMRLNTEITFTVALGNIYDGLGGIRNSYLDANEALKERFTLGDDRVIYSGDVKNGKDSFYTHIKVEEKLLNYIRVGNEEMISEVINTILTDAGNKGLKSDKVKQIILEIISFVGRQLFNSGVSYEDILKDRDNLIEELEECETIVQMEVIISKLLIAVSRYIRSSNGNDENVVITRVKEYIEKNYCEDVSLTQVAKKVELSPQYLSTIFYRETKYNFLEYLNLVRVNKSKELLLDSKLSINEVSIKVGYLNYSTFSKVFKKHMGVSAKQYRIEKGIRMEED